MNFDPYTKEHIHKYGIWNTNCLGKETSIQNFLFDKLASMGWTQGSNYKVWHRGQQQVIVCLVDDIRSCSDDKHTDLPYLFDQNTTVITDGYIECPTRYRVWKLPSSFFGIYASDTEPTAWQPDLQYTFSMNRIDVRRLKLMLEMAKRIHLHKGYVNFNCQYNHHGETFQGNDRVPEYFEQHWNYLSEQDQTNWQASYALLKSQLPLKNYTVPHHEIYSRSFLNIECETYSSDNSAAFSEKIFRLLTTPAPWTCYVGHYGIAYLESLGFDCLSDLIDHNHYDRLKEIEHKIGVFVWKSLQVVKDMRTADINTLSSRCKQAADHNKNLLARYQQQWEQDFEQWQQTYLSQLA